MAALPEELWRLNVGQYHAMIEHGVLSEDDSVELLEGVLLRRPPKNPAHTFSSDMVATLLAAQIPAGWLVRRQDPITLADSEPEPDVAVVRGSSGDYRRRHPRAVDVALVVEVSESSPERDRTLKKRIYASAGIPIYWIVDLVNQRLEIHSSPQGDTYRQATVLTAGDEAPIPIGNGASIPVAQILP